MNYYKNLLESYRRNQDLWNITIFFILCIIAFYNILNSYFIGVDDLSAILHKKRDFIKIFFTNTEGRNSGGNYRPVEAISHIIDVIIFGEGNYFLRRVVNVLIHFVNITLIYFLTIHITRNKIIGLVSGLLFAVHLINSHSLPPVSWIPGRSDLLVALFYLLTVLLFAKSLSRGSVLLYLTSLFAFVLTLMSKELAVTLPLIILLYTVLFNDFKTGKNIFNPAQAERISKAIVRTGVFLFLCGILLAPDVIVFLMPGGRTPDPGAINSFRVFSVFSGFILISGIYLVNFLIRVYKKKSPSLFLVHYSVPYFAILIFFLIIRSLVLGGFGGAYKSSEGNVFLQFGIDSFMRDLLGLASLIWSVGNDYNLTVFKLQVYNPTLFYMLSVLILSGIIIAFYKIIRSKSRVLLFSFLWLFIILIPTHNVLLPPWQTQSRYFYLPAAGFCILLAAYFYSLFKSGSKYSRIIRPALMILLVSVLLISTALTIRYNSKLTESGNLMKKFITDMKQYNSLLTDSTSLYFINFPSSVINSESNIYVTAYMNDLLNYADSYKGFGKLYDYHMMLFVEGEETEKINLTLSDNNHLLLDGINPSKYFLIPNNLTSLDSQISAIYKRTPFHSITQPLSEINTMETSSANVTELRGDNNKVQYKLGLKEMPNFRNSIFFIYEKGAFHPVFKENSFNGFTPGMSVSSAN